MLNISIAFFNNVIFSYTLFLSSFHEVLVTSVLAMIVFDISQRPVLFSTLLTSDQWENSLCLTVSHSLPHKHKTRRAEIHSVIA